ncbi:MAG: hypothetical protein Q7U47_03580 [Paludibacter sp.]|nr:hypothetical protein [Paludibacter sp.]
MDKVLIKSINIRTLIFLFIIIQIRITAYSQVDYNPFISQLKYIYAENSNKYCVLSKKVMSNYYGNKSIKCLTYTFIPELLLNRDNDIYKNIDSTNIVKYFDGKSLFFHKALVARNNNFVGVIWSYTSNKNRFNPKPDIRNFIFENLFIKLNEIKPDIIFTVQNIDGYFYIKDNELFVLDFSRNENFFTKYTLIEFTRIYKDDIFSPFFYFTPRVKNILYEK